MKKIFLFIIFSSVLNTSVRAQYENSRWVLGTFAQLDFSTGNAVYEDGNYNTISTTNNASLCKKDSSELLMYCDGSRIYNKLGMIMENGDSINPGQYNYWYYPAGIGVWNGVSIIPNIYHNNQYYVFYNNIDSIHQSSLTGTSLYFSIVDMSYNNGLGKVIQKDVTILNHLLEPGRLNAIRHANGRDWWLIVNGFMDAQHFIYLVDYTGIHLVNTQTIGTPFISTSHRNNQSVVNQSGNQMAYLYSTLDNTPHLINRIDLYNFDRCSGLLSNYKTISFIDSSTVNGVAFSPNDSLLYVNTFYNLFQFNLKDVNDTNKINVGRWDSIYDPFQTIFNMEKLGPDGKIYVSTWGSTKRLHCITNPNVRGIGCNFVQGYFITADLNHLFRGSLPNYPNFRLGALVGSACDTVQGVVRPEIGAEVVEENWTVFPNPSNGTFQIHITTDKLVNSEILIYNTLGVIKAEFKNYKSDSAINLSELMEGTYLIKIISKNSICFKKIAIIK